METSDNSILKIFASTTDRMESKLLYEYLVHYAKVQGISGVTVFRGIMGFGMSSKISSSRFWELTEKLPVTIEMIDETNKLENFYELIEPKLLKMPKGCLVIMEPIKVKLYKPGKQGNELNQEK